MLNVVLAPGRSRSRFSVMPVFYFILISLILSCKTDRQVEHTAEMHIRLAKEPELLNPFTNTKPVAREVYQYIFLPLADFDPKTLEFSPIMIKSIPSMQEVTVGSHKGQKSLTFEIVDDATWQDGKPITANDYLFTIKAIMNPQTDAAAHRSFVKNIHDVEVDPSNNKKATVYFDKFHMLNKEIALNFEIYPKHIYDPNSMMDKLNFSDIIDENKFGELLLKDSTISAFAKEFNSTKYGREIVAGSGPYSFKSWSTGQQIILEKKQNYWGSKYSSPYLKAGAEKLIFDVIPDETAAIAALKGGDIDLMTTTNGTAFQQLKDDAAWKDKLNFFSPKLMKYYFLVLNNKDPKLQGLKTRRALAHLTDVNRFITTFEGGNAERTVGPYNPAKRYYNRTLTPIEYNIDKAKALLAEDGWKDSDNNGILDKKINGKKTELKLDAYASGEVGKNICLLLQESFKQCNIQLEVNQKEFKLITSENLEKGKFSIVPTVQTQEVVDDDLELSYHSKNAVKGGRNYGGFKNPVIDELIVKIQKEANTTIRDEYYRQFQQIVYDQQPYIFLYVPHEKIIVSKRWKGEASTKRPGYNANAFSLVSEFAKTNAN